MKLILTRHGETEENKIGITQGHLPGKLTELGIEQAKKLALRFKDEKIDAIYSSDLARAADTAKKIAKFHPEAPFQLTKELREREHGDFTGKKHSEIEWSNFPENAETEEQIVERAKKFIDGVYERYKDSTVLFMGHGGINSAVISVIIGKEFQEVFDMESWRNTNVNVFEIYEDKSHKIHCLNCVKHLEEQNN